MLTNFAEVTHELDEEEIKLIPILIAGFKSHPKDKPIKAPDIINAINQQHVDFGLTKKFTEVRLRKLVNHIRCNALLPVMATSEGYYTSYDKKEITDQVKSLRERANAILNAANGLQQFIA